MDLQPMDIVVVAGLPYMPHHWLIQAATHHRWVHNAVVRDRNGAIYNPIFTGVKDGNINQYRGREVAICRRREPFDIGRGLDWCQRTQQASKGYDFLSWLGFVTGIKEMEDEQRWACSEFSYWAYQSNGVPITTIPEVFPSPAWPVYHVGFETVFRGRW
jgi:hypothetical protein